MDFKEFKEGLEREVRHDGLQESVMMMRRICLQAALSTTMAPNLHEAVEIWLAANDGDARLAIRNLQMHRDAIDEYLTAILNSLIKRAGSFTA